MSLSASESGTPSSSACSWAATNDFSAVGLVALAQREERVAAVLAEVDLAQHDEHLLPHRAAERLRDAAQRVAVAEPRAHADGEDVEEVRQRALDRLLAQPPRAREQTSGANQPSARRAAGSRSGRRAEQQHEPAAADAEQQRERRLAADEALDGHPGRPARVVELVLERRPPAARAGSARAAGRAAPRAPRPASPSPTCARWPRARRRSARRGARPGRRRAASGSPAGRARGTDARQRAEQQRHQTSILVVLRISTNATVHSAPATAMPGDADRPSWSSASSRRATSRSAAGSCRRRSRPRRRT